MQFSLDCTFCQGVGCDECEGGWLHYRRCPNALIKEDPHISEFLFWYFRFFEPHGIFYSGQCLGDQSHTLVQALSLFMRESSVIDAEDHRKAKAEQRRIDMKAAAGMGRHG